MRLYLKNIQLVVSLGVFDWEKQQPRRIRLDVTAEYDATRAAAQDKVEYALDYSALERTAVGVARSKHFDLVETLVTEIGQAILAFQQVKAVEVSIEKPGALPHSEGVVVSERFTR